MKDLDNIIFYYILYEYIIKFIFNYDGVIFNLGYLFKGDKSIIMYYIFIVNILKFLYEKY